MKTRTPHLLTPESDGLEKLVYAHIPKAGGNTLSSSVKVMANIGHRSAINRRKNNCFSTVRNPFEWLISLWHSNWRPSGTRKSREPDSLANPRISIQECWPKLETFLYEFNSFENCSKVQWNAYGMWHLVSPDSLEPLWAVFGSRSPWGESGHAEERLKLLQSKEKHIPLFSYRHLQVCQTFDLLDSPGEKYSFAAFYIRLEKLEEAINQFPQNKIKENRPQRVGSSSHKDYRYYYDTKLIDHITAHRKQELDLLGYDFEGPTDDLSVFKINKPFLWK